MAAGEVGQKPIILPSESARRLNQPVEFVNVQGNLTEHANTLERELGK